MKTQQGVSTGEMEATACHCATPIGTWGRSSVVSTWAPNLWTGLIPVASMLDGSFILAISAIHLIIMVPACLLGLT